MGPHAWWPFACSPRAAVGSWPLPASVLTAAGSQPPREMLLAAPACHLWVGLFPVLLWDMPKLFSVCQLSHLSNCKTHVQARQWPSSPSHTHLAGSPDLCRPPGAGLCPSADTPPSTAVAATCRIGCRVERTDLVHSKHRASGGKAFAWNRLHTQGLRLTWGGSRFCTVSWWVGDLAPVRQFFESVKSVRIQ